MHHSVPAQMLEFEGAKREPLLTIVDPKTP